MELLRKIQNELKANAGQQAKTATEKFVPGAEKVYGVRNPFLNTLSRKYKQGGFPLVTALWHSGAFEEKILAAKMIKLLCRKSPLDAIHTVTVFSTEISNWAVCDTLGMQSLKPIAPTFQKEIFQLSDSLIHSPDVWQRRLSLVLLEVYTRQESLKPKIRKAIRILENDKEYYVRKAVDWLNRNLEKKR